MKRYSLLGLLMSRDKLLRHEAEEWVEEMKVDIENGRDVKDVLLDAEVSEDYAKDLLKLCGKEEKIDERLAA